MKFSLPAIAIRRPISVLMLLITFVGLGVIAWQRLPLEFLPKLDFPFIICTIPYPGSTPEQVEKEIAIPAEGEFRTISQLKRIVTSSNSNMCTIRMIFGFDADMDIAAMEVRDRMERLKLELPESVDRLFLQRWSSDTLPIMVLSLSSDMNYDDFSYLVRTVAKSRLLRVDGAADVQIFGKPEKEVLIQLDQNLLKQRNVSLYQLITTLQQSSLNVAVGDLSDGALRYYVRVLDELRTPEQLRELVVGPNSLRLKDVAEVGYSSREEDADYDIDGKKGLVLFIRKESEANTVAVCTALQHELDAMLQEPSFKGTNSFIIFDQSKMITSALSALVDAGKSGALLAIGVLFLFLMRIRPTLLVALAIPTSVVAALAVMFFAGISLNIITMLSLIVALGMLVDNSIVVIENIYRYNQLGLGPVESAIRGADEVGMAITASTLTTIVVFVSIMYMDAGELSSYMQQFGIPITVALIASLFVALTMIPLAASHMPELRPGQHHPLHERLAVWARIAMGAPGAACFQVIDRLHPIKAFIDGYEACMAWVLRWRMAAVLLTAILMLVTAVIPLQSMHVKGTPEPDQRQVNINLTFDQNFDLDMSRNVVEQIKEIVNAKKDKLGIKNVFANYWTRGAAVMLFLVQEEDLPEGQKVPYSTREVRDIMWQSMPQFMPGIEVKFEIAQAGEGEKGIVIRLRGDDSSVLADYAETLKKLLVATVPDLEEVHTGQERAAQEIQLRIDETLAAQAGVSPYIIARTVDFALRGTQLPYLKQGGREVPLWAQFREQDRKSKANLDNVGILTERAGLVPLGRLVDYTHAITPQTITRENGKNVTSVTAMVRSNKLSKVAEDIKTVTAQFQMPQGYTVEMGDTIQELDTDMSNFMMSMILSCVLIYIVMAALFESYLLPLSILFSIPLAGVGVAWTMYLTDTPMDGIALIGTVLMGGIIVNNGIVIVDHINQLRKQGLSRSDAVVQAGRDRFRPVMMTALTTILGCVPVAIGSTMGSALAFNSLGLALIGGLSAGTLLTLVIVPLAYTLIDDLSDWSMNFLANVAGMKRRAVAPDQGDGPA